MDRRTFITSLVGSSLVPLFASNATGASGNLKGFMLSTLENVETIKADVARIAALGGTIVRFPLYFTCQPDIQVWLNKLEAVYAVSNQHRVILVIDIHHPSPIPDPTKCIEQDSTIRDVDDFVNKWSVIAKQFANRGRIWYDLCNEPKPYAYIPNNKQIAWKGVALRAAQAIRKQDSRNTIVFAARGTTTADANSITPLSGITNQVLQFHFYNWSALQFNLAPRYPSGKYTRENLRRLLQGVSNAGKKHRVPVYIGEVAINKDHPNAPEFLRDFTSLCDQLGIHLTIHAYREAPLWNYENKPQAWQVLTSWLQKR